MNGKNFSVEAFVISTLIFLVLFIILSIISVRVKRSGKDFDETFSPVFYSMVLFFVIGVFSIILVYFGDSEIARNPFVVTVLWVVIIGLTNRFTLLKTNKRWFPNDLREAVAFLSLVICAFFFLVQGFVENKTLYWSVMWICLSLIIGFYLPIGVILNDSSIKKKIKEIVRNLKLNSITKSTRYVFALLVLIFFIEMIIANWHVTKFYEIEIQVGLIIGVLISLPIIVYISDKARNELVDCTDTRKEIFESESFVEYRKNVERFLSFSETERYDSIEAHFFYEAFIEKVNNGLGANSLFSTISKMKTLYSFYEKAQINPQENTVESYRIEYNSRRFCCDNFTLHRSLVRENIAKNKLLPLNDGCVPNADIERYRSDGFEGDREIWLLFFLENYHNKRNKEKRKIVSKEIRSFLNYTYTVDSMMIVPSLCNNEKLHAKKGCISINDFGDLYLEAIYHFYIGNCDDIEKLFSNGSEKNAFINWLELFKNWERFVDENNLSSMVVSNHIHKELNGKYGVPKMYFKNHSFANSLPSTQKEWDTMFRNISDMIYKR